VGRRKVQALAERFWPKVDRSSVEGCWLWTSALNNKGYGFFNMGGHAGPIRLAHRVAYELTYGPIPEGQEVCHSCDTPRCVRPDHLFLGTHTANMRDASGKRRLRGLLTADHPYRGEQHGNAKLNDEIVQAIRRRYAAGGVRQRDLADEYGVTQQLVSHVIRRTIWDHIA
jgi:predicted XRE-type DNA-binding protein